MKERATLVGVATGRPDGGVAVVRVSGPRAKGMVEGLVGELPGGRRLVRRRIELGEGDSEDGLVVLMAGPRSFTGEDVAELHVHAGARNVAAVVEVLLRQGGVAAGPGDFSRRAFELGRLSLDQAEGIAAVIGARTDAALSQARRLAAGELGAQVDRERRALLELRAEVEANLDFPEDVDPGDVERWQAEAKARRDAVGRWLSRFEAGRRARARARIVLAGPPNAGKSSLFNALLGRARALVADQPGTTRDYVEAELEIDRYGCTLVDTAGLREGVEAIERAGVALTRAQVEGADVVLWVEAADEADADDSSLTAAGGATVIRVESKRDRGMQRPSWIGVSLEPDGDAGTESVASDGIATDVGAGDLGEAGVAGELVTGPGRDEARSGHEAEMSVAGGFETEPGRDEVSREMEPGRDAVRGERSGHEFEAGSGVEGVRDALLAWFGAGQDTAWIGLARHHDRAREALAAMDEACDHLRDDERLELAAFALGVAEVRLGEITGRSALGPVGQEVLASIFARFCIGK